MRLAVLKGFHDAKDVAVESVPFVMGRCKTANFIIPDVKVSRNHCQILRDDVSWKIEDFSSSGTYVNNSLVGKGKTVVLNENDVIRLGSLGSKLEWTFCSLQTSNSTAENTTSHVTPTFCEQSQILMDLHSEKCKVEEKIYKNNILHERKRNEERNLNEKYQKYFKSTSTGAVNKVEVLGASKLNRDHADEKENSCSSLQSELRKCSNEIIELENENKKLISHLIDVKKKVEVEMTQLDSCFQKEKNKLEAEIKQKQATYHELSESSNKDSSNSLAEQNILIEKLNALEGAQKRLILQLENANTLNFKNRTGKEIFEENEYSESEQQSTEKEVKTSNVKDEASEGSCNLSNEKENSNLLHELEEVKNALSALENKNSDLEGKLEEAINKENGTLRNLTDLLETELQCTICSELFVTTVTLNCTHSFCEFCLNSWKQKQKTCPICRKKIMSENRSLVIDTYIDKMVESLSVELKERRKALFAERNELVLAKTNSKPRGKKRSRSRR